MDRERNKQTVVPPTEVEGTIMIPAREPDDLMVPPKPISDNKLEVAGGQDTKPPLPEMKVVELKEGGYVITPKTAIFESKEDAEKFMMTPPPKAEKFVMPPPPPPILPHEHHFLKNGNHHRGKCKKHEG